jgi:hypothetical protein
MIPGMLRARLFMLRSGPPGLVADGVCLDFTGGVPGCVSPVRRVTLQ